MSFPVPEHKAETIQLAADMLRVECAKIGTALSESAALEMARHLYDVFHRPGGPLRYIPAGEVAQRFRDRYERDIEKDQSLFEVTVAATEAPFPVPIAPGYPNPSGD